MEIKDTKVIDYNKNHYAVMANAIIKGKQTMSLQEAKLMGSRKRNRQRIGRKKEQGTN